MLTFLFWNMGGESPRKVAAEQLERRNANLRAAIGNLVRVHQVDLLILAEWPIPQGEILNAVNEHVPQGLEFRTPDPASQCERVAIYPRFPARFMTLAGAVESTHATCRRVQLPNREKFLLVAVHFGSKLYKSEDSQTLAAPGLSSIVREAERKASHQRTILVGDLNLNPFDTAMVGAEGLNAVMTREIAQRGTRTVDQKKYPYFYNPMWSCFGDASHGECPVDHPEHQPPGTCYFHARESKWYYWYILDQVLLRPELVPRFDNRHLRILVGDGSRSFLDDRGRPDKMAFSDHLPLLFRLNI